MRVRGQPRARDAQRQRQMAAIRGDLGRVFRLRLYPRVACDAGEHLKRLVSVEDVHRDVDGPSEHDEPSPAGDQHPRRPAPREQRRYLTPALRVVEHDQDLPVGEQVAIYLRPLVKALWHVRTRYAERPEKALEHLHRADRMDGSAMKVGEQQPVRELVSQAVGCMHANTRLAYAALAHEHHRGHRTPFLRPGRGEEMLIDLVDLLLAAA